MSRWQDFPVGLVSVHVGNALSPRDLISDTVRFIALALRRYWAQRAGLSEGEGGEGSGAVGEEGRGRFTESGCYNSEEGSYFKDGQIVYRYCPILRVCFIDAFLCPRL